MEGIGWTKRGDFEPSEKRGPFFPRLQHVFYFIPMVLRFCVFYVKEWWNGRDVFINMFSQMKHDSHTGVPLGGIGCGSIGTDFRGGFKAFSLVPGIKETEVRTIKANQFILTVHDTDGKLLYHKCLTAARYPISPLSTWKTDFPPEQLRYRGLFPRSWTEYSIPELQLILTCEAISPVIPHNYKDSSLPVANFIWKIENRGADEYVISISFSFRNGTGFRKWEKERVCTPEFFNTKGIVSAVLHHTIKEMPVTYGIFTSSSSDHSMSATTFDPSGDGSDVWNSLQDGKFLQKDHCLDNRQELGIIVSQHFAVPPNQTEEAEFALVWYMPVVSFGLGQRRYNRRYTRFFNSSHTCETLAIGRYALDNRKEWQAAIAKWQNPVIEDESLPEWYRSALFNELYFITDGSVSWFEYDENWTEIESLMSVETITHFKDYGRFAYMESWEYRMYNTYDVHFYASFALLENWPQLELSMQMDFSDQVFTSDARTETTLNEGTVMQYKRSGRLPHDIGHPKGEPWVFVNAYVLHDTGDWKDLNLKYVLLSMRDYEHIIKKCKTEAESLHLLSFFYARSREIIENGLVEWDIDGDGIIENSGFPDQTYDVWLMTGTSAYCGSLWLAALESLRRMSKKLKLMEDHAKYSRILRDAKSAFIKKLWNGKYFNFDEKSSNHDTIMIEQLCGVWFLSMIDRHLNTDIIDREKIETSLQTIFEHNLKMFNGGSLGPVNGMKPNGVVDLCSVQSEEVWSGIAYAFASFFLIMGDRNRGFASANGMFESCWERFGLQYQTPESIFPTNYYRAIGYMRPLSIWAMHLALNSNNFISHSEATN